MAAVAQNLQWLGNDLSGMIVIEGELTAATGDDCDSPQLRALVPVLSRLRGAFGMEMVFIGSMHGGMLTGRRDASPDDGCNPFEAAYGRGLLEARCSASQFEAVTVCSSEGIESGTLVCGVVGDGYQPPPDSLKSVSRLLATSMRRMTAHGAPAFN